MSSSISASGQAALVPAAGLRVAELHAGRDRLVQALRVDARLAGDLRLRRLGEQRRQVERARAGPQLRQRPGGERRDRGLGVELRTGGLRARQLRADGYRRERAGGAGAGLPGPRSAVDRLRSKLRVQSKRRVGGDACAAAGCRQRAAQRQRRHTMLAPRVAPELDAGGDVAQRRCRFVLQLADAQLVDRQRERQAQRLRLDRERGGRRRRADLHALDARAFDDQAEPRAVVRPPGPMRIAPGELVEHDGARAGAHFDALRAEGAAEHATCRLRGRHHRRAREQPGVAGLCAEQPRQRRRPDYQRAGEQREHGGNPASAADPALRRSRFGRGHLHINYSTAKRASACGPKAKFKVRKDPFGLSLSKPLAPPFGLSLSKPSCPMQRASTGSAWPFDKLRANGGSGAHKGCGERTFVNSRSGL